MQKINNLRKFPPNCVRQVQLERLLTLRIMHRRKMFEIKLRLRQLEAVLPSATHAAHLVAAAQAMFTELDAYCAELDNLIRSEREYWDHVEKVAHEHNSGSANAGWLHERRA